jgi:hypothetical protein
VVQTTAPPTASAAALRKAVTVRVQRDFRQPGFIPAALRE